LAGFPIILLPVKITLQMLRTLLKIDWLIFASAFLLVSLSLLMIFSTSVSQTGTDWSFLIRQSSYAVFGLILFFFFSLLDYRVLVRFSWIAYLGLLGLMSLT
jgi:rod shape determining protein RodA